MDILIHGWRRGRRRRVLVPWHSQSSWRILKCVQYTSYFTINFSYESTATRHSIEPPEFHYSGHLYKSQEQEKKRAYDQMIREMEYGSFTPLECMSITGGMGSPASTCSTATGKDDFGEVKWIILQCDRPDKMQDSIQPPQIGDHRYSRLKTQQSCHSARSWPWLRSNDHCRGSCSLC